MRNYIVVQGGLDAVVRETDLSAMPEKEEGFAGEVLETKCLIIFILKFEPLPIDGDPPGNVNGGHAAGGGTGDVSRFKYPMLVVNPESLQVVEL